MADNDADGYVVAENIFTSHHTELRSSRSSLCVFQRQADDIGHDTRCWTLRCCEGDARTRQHLVSGEARSGADDPPSQDRADRARFVEDLSIDKARQLNCFKPRLRVSKREFCQLQEYAKERPLADVNAKFVAFF